MKFARFGPAILLCSSLVSLILSLLSGDNLQTVLSFFLIIMAMWGLLAPSANSANSRAAKQLASLRQQNIYPPLGHGTDEDVKRVLRASNRIFAVKLYREIHGVTLKEAVTSVKSME